MSLAKALLGASEVMNKLVSDFAGSLTDAEEAKLTSVFDEVETIAANLDLRERFGDSYSIYLLAVARSKQTDVCIENVIDNLLRELVISDDQHTKLQEIHEYLNTDEDSYDAEKIRKFTPFMDYFGADLLQQSYDALHSISMGSEILLEKETPKPKKGSKSGKGKRPQLSDCEDIENPKLTGKRNRGQRTAGSNKRVL